jgi:hypothetical protein
LVAKVKPNTNSVGVHPQLSNNRHPVDDGALMMGAGSLWLSEEHLTEPFLLLFARRFQIQGMLTVAGIPFF